MTSTPARKSTAVRPSTSRAPSYERIPLYVRSGSIIPFGPEMQYSDEEPPDVINLYVYAGEDGEFTLYEDENVNYNYEKGRYAMIPFKWDNASRTLSIGDRIGQISRSCSRAVASTSSRCQRLIP